MNEQDWERRWHPLLSVMMEMGEAAREEVEPVLLELMRKRGWGEGSGTGRW